MSKVKLIYKPTVVPIAKTVAYQVEQAEFLAENGVMPQIKHEMDVMEFAGRVCYMSFDKPRPGGKKAYFDNIIEQKHGSVLEHHSISFAISGVSRSLTHELVRHRVGVAYSQLSQRYVGPEHLAFVVPVDMIQSLRDGEHQDWLVSLNVAAQVYRDYCEKHGKSKKTMQAARSILPNCTETKLVFTANVRSLRHLIELRTGEGAEPEIRRLFNAIYKIVYAELPHCFGGSNSTLLADGTQCIKFASSKI